jgi:hypothetical protein
VAAALPCILRIVDSYLQWQRQVPACHAGMQPGEHCLDAIVLSPVAVVEVVSLATTAH